MSEFNKDDYLNDLPDSADFASADGQAAQPEQSNADNADPAQQLEDDMVRDAAVEQSDDKSDASEKADKAEGDADADADDSLTPLGKAKKEAADYLEALQRERAEFINYRNRMKKEMDRARQQGIIDVLTAMFPALDDVDRIREHGGEMSDSFNAVVAKIDKAFEKFGVEKFGLKGEEFDPTKHDAILHKPDSNVDKPMVDTVVEAGYRINDRVIRPARVVVASPQE